jgi:hypothetical protein
MILERPKEHSPMRPHSSSGRIRLLAVAFSLLATLLLHPTESPAQPGPPEEWELLQNDPNPFCPEFHGVTQIDVVAASAAHLELVVLSPDSASVVRTLASTDLPGAGFFSVWWDGDDANGGAVPPGIYPYRVVATELGGGDVIFEDTKLATVACPSGVEPRTWGGVKGGFLPR